MSPGQALPSFNLALHPDHYKTVLPNLSYPSRPITHIPWSGSSGALLFSKTTRAENRLTIAASIPIVQVPIPATASTCFDASFLVPGAFHGVGTLIWHKFSMLVQKLKIIKQKLFGV